jgi:hypothetical protein
MLRYRPAVPPGTRNVTRSPSASEIRARLQGDDRVDAPAVVRPFRTNVRHNTVDDDLRPADDLAEFSRNEDGGVQRRRDEE